MAHRRLHHELAVQILLDRLHLGGRLDDDEARRRRARPLRPRARRLRCFPLRHLGSPRPRATATHRCPSSCRARPASSRDTSVAPTRGGASPHRTITSRCAAARRPRARRARRPRRSSRRASRRRVDRRRDASRTASRHGDGNSCTMSVHDRTSVAPSRRSPCGPRAVSDVIRPGTANTSRPKSAAAPAVINAPLRSAASTTTTPRASPAMVRLRAGKFHASRRRARRKLRHERAAALRSRRRARDSRADSSRSMPCPSTAIVRPPAASAPRCAAVSMPRASPLTIVTPRAARSAARRSATSTPYARRASRADDGDRERVARARACRARRARAATASPRAARDSP